jgi:hypothetical protein
MRQRALAKIDVLLIVLVVLGGLFVLLSRVTTVASQGPAADRARCLANLRIIGDGLTAYLEANDQRWPYVAKLRSTPMHDPPWPTLPAVLRPFLGDLADDKAYRCPADRRTLADDSPLVKQFSKRTTWFETEGSSYEWMWGEVYGGVKVGEESLAKARGFGLGRADLPLLADFEPFHAGDNEGTFNTLNADLKPRTARRARSGK